MSNTVVIMLADLPLLQQLNLTATEYDLIVTGMGREPNFNELSMFSVLWSEHCCYKNSRHLLKKLPTKGKAILQGPGENAGVIDCGDGLHVAFKIESHNHPTAVEPYQGAATGVGGILRDIFTMNARPVANLNSLRFGPLTDPHNHYLFRRAVKGIGDYGNCVGVPTIGGEVFFDPSYSGNPLVNAMAVGLLQGPIVSSQAAGIGNPVVYVGSATGKDGMGGAAFASRELDDNSQSDRPAVQVGDPFAEKLLIEACLEAFQTGCVIAAQDMGAAGLTSSSCEMSAKGNVGMRMDLNKVPAREPDMKAFEYLLSESQERMLFVLEEGREQPVMDIFKKWGLNAVVIGEVIERPYVEIYHHGKKVVDIPAKLLAEDSPSYNPDIIPEEPAVANKRRLRKFPAQPNMVIKTVVSWLKRLLGSPNISRPERVFHQYDRHVQNNTAQSSDHASAGIIRLRHAATNAFSGKALAVTTDCNPRYVYLNPYAGAQIAVAEAYRNLVAVGASPIAVTDNLNFGNPNSPDVYYQLYWAVEGIKDACLALDTPVTGGNVSLYNETRSKRPDGSEVVEAIFPTPVIGMVGLISDESRVFSPCFKQTGDSVYLIGYFQPTLSGSEYQSLTFQETYGDAPVINLTEELSVAQLIQSYGENFTSIQDVSLGGLLVTLTECLLLSSTQLGLSLCFDAASFDGQDWPLVLFGESNASYIVSFPEARVATVEQFAQAVGMRFIKLGNVNDTGELQLKLGEEAQILSREDLSGAWRSGLQI